MERFMDKGNAYGKTEPSMLENISMASNRDTANIPMRMEGLTRVCGKKENLSNFAIRSERISNNIYIDFSIVFVKLALSISFIPS
jgi:hypothetical protein